ncbi:CoA pyrophosphatase [Rhodohalobacter sp. SW132]|uniref:NUDIX hydrolase n=1 Tax=Rhodohalobacter sp. SW132 TaxID=2293433 RepID=UPI000E27584B|nr:CoA pyrophosphatase [Rhodohalobacter sp. SW132]REL33094.1 CoA pyrophosphatase [Rhodohalobacter sp. SW132]
MNIPFYRFLEERLQQPLPGKEAQMKMMPEPVDPDEKIPIESIDSSGHPSGVLVPIYPDLQGNMNVILTLRTDSIRHAGQISFPGGRSDNGESATETALRETREEIGIENKLISIAGSLSPFYLYRSHNRITPVVGFLREKPQMKKNPYEVEEIITVKLDRLISEERIKKERWDLEHNSFYVPFWDIHKVPLWGATAMMMSELLVIYREFLEE